MIMDLLVASLLSFLHVWAESSEGRSGLGRLQWFYALSILILLLTQCSGRHIKKLCDLLVSHFSFASFHHFISDLPGVFFGFHDAVCSPAFLSQTSETITEQVHLN